MVAGVRVYAQTVLATMSYLGLNSVAAQAGINLTSSPVNIHKILFRPVGTVTTCTVAVDTSADGVTWNAGGAIAGTACTANGEATSASPTEANFVRINITAFSGTGSVNIVYSGLSTIAGGSVSITGTVTTAGGAAAGSAPSGNPVLVAGQDNAPTVRVVRTNANGGLALISTSVAAGDGVSAGPFIGDTGSATFPGTVATYVYNGTGSNFDRQFYCPNSTTVNVAATTTQIVAASGSTKIRVCSFILSPNATAGSYAIEYGTGASCGTGTTSLSGTINALGTVAAPVVYTGGNQSPLITPASQALCVLATTTTVTGVITWVQY